MPDAIMLSETKCKQKIEVDRKLSFQTELAGNGGAVTIFKNDSAKLVKSLNQNIIWTTARFDGALVHFVTVYIPPENKTIADVTLR